MSLVLTVSVMASAPLELAVEPFNALNLGELAKTDAPISIAIQPVSDLNFKTKQEVLDERLRMVHSVAGLVGDQYTPNEDVFGKIEDTKPWWGMAGAAIWGPGSKSSQGPAEESRFLLNPYLLVAPNSYSSEIWNVDKITEDDLKDQDFPYFWIPSSLFFYPKEKRATATYQVDAFNRQLEVRRSKLKEEVIDPFFGVTAYNARDFGFNYIYVDEQQSTNIKNAGSERKDVTKISQMIHCGGSCDIPGGCNNMSPRTPEIDKIKYTALPAQAVILLWKQKPRDIKESPDFTFTIDLR